MNARRHRIAALAAGLIALAAVSWAAPPTPLPTAINHDTTLTAAGGPYALQGDTSVNANVTLTCQAGTVVQAPAGALLKVYGRLVATQTTFRAASTTAGREWGGLELLSTEAAQSKLTKCAISNAGAGAGRALYFTAEAAAKVSQCQVLASAGDGIVCYNASPALDGNAIKNCTGAAIRLKDLAAPTFPAAQTFQGNGTNGTVLDWTSALDVDYTLPVAGQPYYIGRLIYVGAGRKLTVQPGVNLLFRSAGAGLIPYGTLLAPGTAAAPIRFTFAGQPKTRGAWGGLEFRGKTSSASALTHCIIEYAGGWAHGVAVMLSGTRQNYPTPTFTACRILQSGGDGLRSNAGAPRLDNCTITGSRGTAIVLAFGGIADFVTPCHVSGNGSNTATFDKAGSAVIFPQVWKDPGCPYLVLGTVATMEPGATVTLQPGLQLLMGSEVYLNLRRAPMRALGTAAKPIVMKAASAAKRWSGIFITAAGVGSEFQHCRISGAGASGAAGLMAEGVPGAAGVTIANCSFTDSAGPGLYLKSSGAAISRTTLRSLKGSGLVLAGASRGVFANGVIQGNSQPGVYLTGTSTLTLTPNNVISGNRSYDVVNQTRSNINATRNYWGTASATTIAKHIFDGKDNSRFGVVRFTPILSAVPTGGASATAAGVAITSAAAAPLSSGAVQVTYTLSAPAQVRARVMNIAGRPIRTVAAQQEAAAGANTLLWDGRSDAGVAVPNGAYFVELLAQTADGAQARVLASAHLDR